LEATVAEAAKSPTISVIVCFVDDGVAVPECIDAILASDSVGEVEVVAVNNRPMAGDAEQLRERYAAEPRVVVVDEVKRGLSAARNFGAQTARAGLLVFTDDDVVPTDRWLRALRMAIESEPGAICATGPIQALRLETPAQLLMDRYAGFVKASARTVFRLADSIDDPLFPYTAGRFGSGANIAVTSEAFERLGGFDETLGVGTESRSGEDLEYFMRLMLAGETIVYEPDALVLHDHPDTMEALKREVFGYGSGLTAAAARTLLRGPDRGRLLRALGSGVGYALNPRSPKNERKGTRYPLGLTLRELAGMAYGPLGLLRSTLADRRAVASPAPETTPFEPVWVSEVELDTLPRSLKVPQGVDASYTVARLLVRRTGTPLGFVELPLRGSSISRTRIISESVELEKDSEYRPAIAPSNPAMFATVVVCTRERPESLTRTLASLAKLDYPNFEVVVVDNAPTSDATQQAVLSCADDRISYVVEPRKGLSRARNRGVAESNGELIAFTDDDIVVDSGWLSALAAAATAQTGVGCVTGLVPTAELETPAQAKFESSVQWSRSFKPRTYDMNGHSGDHPLYPFKAGVFGTGANFAITRTAYEKVGAFDEALGAGTPAGGGEDLDYFLRVVLNGFGIAYEPAAITWHFHRADKSTLESQMWTYGSGLSAYAFKHATTPSNWPLIVKTLAHLARSQAPDSTDDPPADARRRTSADRARLSGLLRGPDLYLTEKAKGMVSRVQD
jgi:GT2 family glycosyltransferase